MSFSSTFQRFPKAYSNGVFMRNKIKPKAAIWTFYLGFSIISATVVGAWHSQNRVASPQAQHQTTFPTRSQDAARGQQQQKESVRQADEVDTTQFPITDYPWVGTSDLKVHAKREAKGQKYNNRNAPRISESSDGIFTIGDWEVGLPALPVSKSSAVIIGDITDAQAYLSEDGTNIYSEFVVQVQQILKNDNQVPIGNSIAVERLGGRVRLPSGKIVTARTNHQDLPRIGRRYVLFLTHDFSSGVNAESLNILTGYEVRDGRVFPLDKLGPKHPINSYKGADEASFMNDLVKVLVNP
jgi:hypothetical protein